MHEGTNGNTYDGPAGLVISRDEAFRVWQLLMLNPRAGDTLLRERLKRYLESDWHERADARSASMGC